MPAITITISDHPRGHGITVATTAPAARPGRGLTGAEALSMEMLALARHAKAQVDHDASKVPLHAFADACRDPESFGHAVPGEVVRAAVAAIQGGQE